MDINNAPCGLLTLDAKHRIQFANQRFCDYVARPLEALLDVPLTDLMSTPSRVFYLGHIIPLLQSQGHTEENYMTLQLPNDEAQPILVNARARTEEQRVVYDLVVITMHRRYQIETQLQAAKARAEQATEALASAHQALQDKQNLLTTLNERLEALSITDPLTGLFNRRVFDREMKAHLQLFNRTQTPFCVMSLDIDFFKKVNDAFGHDAGDKVLVELAETMHRQAREIDVLMRIGGEEFVMILPETELEGATQLAERIRRKIESLALSVGSLTISVGVSQVRAGDDASQLYQRADQALYEAKHSGRNRVVTAI